VKTKALNPTNLSSSRMATSSVLRFFLPAEELFVHTTLEYLYLMFCKGMVTYSPSKPFVLTSAERDNDHVNNKKCRTTHKPPGSHVGKGF